MDEADIDIVGATSSTSKAGLKRTLSQSDSGPLSPRPPPNKRKPGPIPKDVIIRRPSYSPTNTPPGSPIPWMEDTKSQITATAAMTTTTTATTTGVVAVAAISALVVEPSPSPSSICTTSVTPGQASSNLVAPCSNAQPTEKLVNGLAEMPTIPIFEQVEHINNHMDMPPILTPIVNNVNDITKSDVKSEKTDGVKSECGRLLPVNDCAVNKLESSVKGDSASPEERLMNHVEEKVKSEKERKLTRKELEEIRRHNLGIRNLIFREVRRKGYGKHNN